jgi:hypothetical protein
MNTRALAHEIILLLSRWNKVKKINITGYVYGYWGVTFRRISYVAKEVLIATALLDYNYALKCQVKRALSYPEQSNKCLVVCAFMHFQTTLGATTGPLPSPAFQSRPLLEKNRSFFLPNPLLKKVQAARSFPGYGNFPTLWHEQFRNLSQ